MTRLRMGDQETATDYSNRARRLLTNMRMADVQYLTASYVKHPQANYNALAKQSSQPGQRGPSGGGGGGGGKPAKDADKKKSAQDGGREGGSRHRNWWWICRSPDHLSFECLDRSNSDETTLREAARDRSAVVLVEEISRTRRSSRTSRPRRRTLTPLLVARVVEPTVSLASEAGKDFQAVAAAAQANPAVVLLDSGCSHHLMRTKEAFVDLGPSGDVKHVRGFNGALQNVRGHGIVALQGDAGKQVLIPDVLYVPGLQANLLSAGKLKESSVKLMDDDDWMLLGDRGRARVDTITSLTKHKAADGLDIKPSAGLDSPCVSCVGGKLARHTFPDRGSNAEDALAVVHIDLCRPFYVSAKDDSLYFPRLKDRKTRQEGRRAAGFGEPADENIKTVCRSSPPLAPPTPPYAADLCGLPLVSASGDKGSSGASPVAPAKSIAGGRRNVKQLGVAVKLTPTGERRAVEVQPTLVKPAKEASAWEQHDVRGAGSSEADQR
ncbi:unnamed protein product [Closterium sp. Yama58-4]|nr:unnamed protein product [Closterium sp. Yama58-4]